MIEMTYEDGDEDVEEEDDDVEMVAPIENVPVVANTSLMSLRGSNSTPLLAACNEWRLT